MGYAVCNDTFLYLFALLLFTAFVFFAMGQIRNKPALVHVGACVYHATNHCMNRDGPGHWCMHIRVTNSRCMMTSSNGSIFRVADHLCGEFTGHRWIPRAKASDVELSSFELRRIFCWVNNREAWDLRLHRVHYDVTVMDFTHFVPVTPYGDMNRGLRWLKYRLSADDTRHYVNQPWLTIKVFYGNFTRNGHEPNPWHMLGV